MTVVRPTEDELQAYVDGRLDPARAAAVQAYLASHLDDAARVHAYAADRAALREALQPLAEAPIPPNLDVHVLAGRRQPAVRWRWPAAAAMAALIGGAGGWGLRDAMTPPSRGVAALAQEAADNYRVYAYDAARPVEIRAEERDQLSAWVSARLQRPVAAPDLAPAGLRLLGGRLVTTPHGPAALFLYDDAHGQRVAVMMRPMAVEKNARMSDHISEGLGGVAWASDGLGFSLVGATSARALRPIADEVRRAVRTTT